MLLRMAASIVVISIAATGCTRPGATGSAGSEVSTPATPRPLESTQTIATPDPEATAFAVSRAELRDAFYDWQIAVDPLIAAFDNSTGGSARARAEDLVNIGEDIERWFTSHTEFDFRYDEPVSMWRDAARQMTAGAREVLAGDPERGDRLLHEGWAAVGSAEFLGAWGEILTH